MARPRAWADRLIVLSGSLTGTPQALDLLTDVVDSDTVTVARIIGRITVIPASLSATDQAAQRIDVGIGVATQAAFDAGVGSLPDPRVNADAPARGWLYRDSLVMMKQNSTGTVEDWLYPMSHFDVGALRRVDKGVLFVVFAKTSLQGSAFDVQVSGLIRSMCLT